VRIRAPQLVSKVVVTW